MSLVTVSFSLYFAIVDLSVHFVFVNMIDILVAERVSINILFSIVLQKSSSCLSSCVYSAYTIHSITIWSHSSENLLEEPTLGILRLISYWSVSSYMSSPWFSDIGWTSASFCDAILTIANFCNSSAHINFQCNF